MGVGTPRSGSGHGSFEGDGGITKSHFWERRERRIEEEYKVAVDAYWHRLIIQGRDTNTHSFVP